MSIDEKPTAKGSQTSRDQARDATQALVLSAAQTLFIERGYRATTIRDIASQTGMSVGTVMAVGNKSSLLVKIFDEQVLTIHSARSADPMPGPTDLSGTSATDLVVGLLEPFIEIFASNADLAREYGAVLMTGQHDSAILGLAETLKEEVTRVLIASKAHAPTTAAQAAEGVYAAYVGTLFLLAASPDDEHPQIMANLRTSVALFVEAGHREHA